MTVMQSQHSITVFGHRGARGIYPENTMAGFRYLQDIDITAVEIDVQNSADRLSVLAHDARLLIPKDNGAIPVHQLVRHTTAAQLADLQVGIHHAKDGYAALFPDQAYLPNERIPTFATFCEWAAQFPKLFVNVEIKSDAAQLDLYDPPDVIVEDVVTLLEQHNLSGRTVLSSFDWRVLFACAERAPALTRGYLTLEDTHGTSMTPNIIDGSLWMGGATRADHGDCLLKTIADLGGKIWCPFYKDLTVDALAKAQDLGLVVNVWTVNTLDDINRMADMGVNGIISDYPARVRNVLMQRGMA